MIQYYIPGNYNFEKGKNGDYALTVLEGTFHSGQINELPYIEFEIPIDRYGLWQNVVRDGVVRSPIDYADGEDWFRVWATDKTSSDNSILVTARHIAYDLTSTVAKDYSNDDICIVATGNIDAKGALNKLFANTKFTPHTDIVKYDSVRWDHKYILEALLGDDENSFINRWGGELFVHKYDVYMNSKIGSDNGVVISYGKNINEIKENVDMTNLATRIIPQGYDGLRLTGKTPWVDSKYINNYSNIFDKVVTFSNVKVGEGDGEFRTEARAELIRLSNEMYDKQHIDTPIINIKVSMIDLSVTDEYKNYKCLETVNKGDTVHCRHNKLNIDTKSRCISYTWDIVNKKKISNEIGDVEESYFNRQSEIANTLDKIIKNGRIDAGSLTGIINAYNTVLKAQYSVAEKQHVRAMLFEDLDPSSPTFGASCYGTMGWQISKERTPDGKDWKWSTAATGKGIVADAITVGTLTAILIQSVNKDCTINLNTGEIKFSKGVIKGKNSFWNLDTGVFSTSGKSSDGKIKNVEINNGGIDSLNYLIIKSKEGVILQHDSDEGGEIGIYKWGSAISGAKMNILSDEFNVYSKNIKFSNSVNLQGNKIIVGANDSNNFISSGLDSDSNEIVWINHGASVNGKLWAHALKCTGDKQCIQRTKEYGDIGFSAVEDIGAYLTWREYGGIYETTKSKYSQDNYYSCVVKIPKIIQSTINTKSNYNVEVNAIKSLCNITVWTTKENCFLIKSTEPCKFNFVLAGRRKGFETRSLEEEMLKAQQYQESNSFIINSKNKRKLQELAAKEWLEYGRCYEG